MSRDDLTLHDFVRSIDATEPEVLFEAKIRGMCDRGEIHQDILAMLFGDDDTPTRTGDTRGADRRATIHRHQPKGAGPDA